VIQAAPDLMSSWRRLTLQRKQPAFGSHAATQEDAIDLCDALPSFSSQAKAKLHEISRIMGLPGKPKGFDGSRCGALTFSGTDRHAPNCFDAEDGNPFRVKSCMIRP
jgi:hypothetical protein